MVSISVLQLDTHFPRVAGDIGNPASFIAELEIVTVQNAGVQNIVTDTPNEINIAAFERALKKARGSIIATSCGFMAPWQQHLEKKSPVPFISSSLITLPALAKQYSPEQLLILTFNAAKLTDAFFPGELAIYRQSVTGLPPTSHLRTVIEHDLQDLDVEYARSELIELVESSIGDRTIEVILLECTNLPPYKAALKETFHAQVVDILTVIENAQPGIVAPVFH